MTEPTTATIQEMIDMAWRHVIAARAAHDIHRSSDAWDELLVLQAIARGEESPS